MGGMARCLVFATLWCLIEGINGSHCMRACTGILCLIGCSKPPTLRYAHIPHTNMASTYPPGCSVTYQCDDNYVPVGGSRRLTCKTSGSWTKPSFVCAEIMCGRPITEPEHGSMKPEGKVLFKCGEYIDYICNEGYELIGPQRKQCLISGMWTSGGSWCKELTCDRGDSVPQHGSLNPEGQMIFKRGEQLHLVCDEGYKLFGQEQITCLQVGKWDGHCGMCQERTCKRPHHGPQHGFIEPRGKMVFKRGEEITYSCDEGYELSGQKRKSCLPSGDWPPGQTVCLERICKRPASEPEHASSDPEVVSKFMRDEDINYDCDEGYTLVGQKRRTCLPSGEWTPGLANCKETTCERPTLELEHGSMKPRGRKVFGKGEHISYVCDDGYTAFGNPNRRCLPSGEWSDMMMQCKGQLFGLSRFKRGTQSK